MESYSYKYEPRLLKVDYNNIIILYRGRTRTACLLGLYYIQVCQSV